jgi:hypothetical protein
MVMNSERGSGPIAFGSPAVFPLRYTDDDVTEYGLDSPSAVELRVEFCDDYDPAYRCRDATGRRVRLIVWNLRLLLCQVVPIDFDADALQVWRERSVDRQRLVERYHAAALRALVEAPSRSAQPSMWNVEVDRWEGVEPQEEAQIDGKRFHRDWLAARMAEET